MKSEDRLKDVLKVIKSRASSDFSCMHVIITEETKIIAINNEII